MSRITAQRLSIDWIKHEGGKCPCVGEWVDICYSYGGPMSSGLAADHVNWHYATHYRLIAPPDHL